MTKQLQIKEIAINERMERAGVKKAELWNLEEHGSYYTALLYEEIEQKGRLENALTPVTLFKKRDGAKVYEKQYDFVRKIANKIGVVTIMPNKSHFSFEYHGSEDEVLKELSILKNFSYESKYTRKPKTREYLYLIEEEWTKYNKEFSNLIVSILDYVFERGDEDLFDSVALSNLKKNLEQAFS